MPTTESRTTPRLSAREKCWLLLAGGVALSPLSPKIAGVTWLCFCLWGIALWLRRRGSGGDVAAPPVLSVARGWLLTCGLATVLAGAALWYWSDPPDALNAELRLLLAAAAVYGMLACGGVPARFTTGAGHALASACVVSLLCVAGAMVLFASPRDHLPANAIVWALGAAFSLCLLLPLVLEGGKPLLTRRWWALAVLAGAAAVLLSQSRGALGIFPWMLWLVATHWRRCGGRWPLRRTVALVLVAAAVVTGLWTAPGDPLRLRQVETEIARAEDGGGFDSSMGTRVYLWQMALHGIQSAPLLGIGGAERLKRIKHAGEELPEAQRAGLWYVRQMGHVHNQYLHSALDGGLVALGAIVALLAGMAAIAWRLHRIDPLASRQMQGLLFVHFTAGISNVNFAHNYYVLVLAIGVTMVLLGAARRCRQPVPVPVP